MTEPTITPPSIEEGNRRLLVLADFLDTLPPERFDYNRWVGCDWAGRPDLSCGTTACALGWACAMPEFQALGVKMVKSEEETYVLTPFFEINGVKQSYGYGPDNTSQYLFGLSYRDHEYLFTPAEPDEDGNGGEYEAVPQHVANKIRTFVSGRTP